MRRCLPAIPALVVSAALWGAGAGDGMVKGRYPVMVIFAEPGSELGRRWGQLQEDFAVARWQLRTKFLGPKEEREAQQDLRARAQLSTGSGWALFDGRGNVLQSAESLPDPTPFIRRLEGLGVTSPVRELEAFLRRNPEHHESRMVLLHLDFGIARGLTHSPDAPDSEIQKKRLQAEGLAWGQVSSDLDGMFRSGAWVGDRLFLASLLKGGLPSRRVLDPERCEHWVLQVETELRQRPEDWPLWRLWLSISDQMGGRPLAPLLASLELQPLSNRLSWPPTAVLETYTRQAMARKDFEAALRVLEPRWERDAQANAEAGHESLEEWETLKLPDLDAGLFSGVAERWERVFPLMVESLLKLNRPGAAEAYFHQALRLPDLKPNALSACIEAARSEKRLMLVERWSKWLENRDRIAGWSK